MISSKGVYILLFFLTISINNFLSQVEIVASYYKNEIHHEGRSKLYGNKNQLFIDDYDRKSLLAVDNIVKLTKKIYTCQGKYKISKLLDYENGLILMEYSWQHQNTRVLLFDNNFNYTVLEEFGSNTTNIWFVEENFLIMKKNIQGTNIVQKIDLITLEVFNLFQSTNALWFLDNSDEVFIFNDNSNNISNIIQISNNEIDTLSQINNNFTLHKIPSNDSINNYYKILNNTYRWNKYSKSFKYFSSLNFNSLYHENDSTFISESRRLHIINDTLDYVEFFLLKQKYTNSSNTMAKSFNFPSKYIQVSNGKIGAEISYINNEDSLELIQELRKGVYSSMPTRECSYSSIADYSLIGFEYNNKTYTPFHYAWDKGLWIYEVQDDTLIPSFPLLGFKRYTSFFQKDNFIYWINHDQTFDQYSVYRWNMNNDYLQRDITKPVESKIWKTTLEHSNENVACFDYFDNIRNQNVFMDNEQNTYVGYFYPRMFGFHNNTLMLDHLNEVPTEVKTPHYLLKYDKYGNLLWTRNINDINKVFYRSDKMLINQKNNICIVGQFYDKFSNGFSDTLIQRSNIYFGEFNSNTGKIEKFNTFITTDYIDDFELTDFIQDSKGNSYVAAYYKNYSINIGDTTLTSDFNLQNCIVKLDSNGNYVLAVNVFNTTQNYLGDIKKIEYLNESNQILVFTSQEGSYYCDEEKEWKSELITYDENGKYIKRFVYSGNITNKDPKICYLGNNKTLIKGVYRGEIKADIFENRTELKNGCYNYETYDLIYDNNLNRIIKASNSEGNNGFLTSQIRIKDDFIFILGEYMINKRIAFQKYSLKGELLSEHITQQGNINNIKCKFDTEKDIFSFSGVNLNNDNSIGFSNFNTHTNTFNISNFEINNWKNKIPLTPMSFNNSNDANNLLAYPNPVERTVEINFEANIGYQSYKVFNNLGIQVMEGIVIENIPFVRIDFSSLSKGMYIIKLEGNDVSNSVKIIKI